MHVPSGTGQLFSLHHSYSDNVHQLLDSPSCMNSIHQSKLITDSRWAITSSLRQPSTFHMPLSIRTTILLNQSRGFTLKQRHITFLRLVCRALQIPPFLHIQPVVSDRFAHSTVHNFLARSSENDLESLQTLQLLTFVVKARHSPWPALYQRWAALTSVQCKGLLTPAP